jgi:hypothetical protein
LQIGVALATLAIIATRNLVCPPLPGMAAVCPVLLRVKA